MTKDEAAKKAGLTVYDCALPQQWLDNTAESVSKALYIDKDAAYCIIAGGVVWSYDEYKLLGAPVAITQEARNLKKFFDTNE